MSPELNQEKKRVNYELDVEGIKIPCWKENFSYPKDIQQETQIEGYEKIRVAREEIEKVSNGNNREFFDKILPAFSDGKFPRETYNHILHADHNYPMFLPESLSAKMVDVHEKFIKNRIMLEEIDPSIFRYNRPGSNMATVKLLLNEKNIIEFVGQIKQFPKANKVYLCKYLGQIDDDNDNFAFDHEFDQMSQIVYSEDEFNEKTKNKIILDSVNGLNITAGKLWQDIIYGKDLTPNQKWIASFRPTFGFNSKEHPFNDYLHKINYIYNELPASKVKNFNKESVKFMISDNRPEQFKEYMKEAKIHLGEPILPIMIGNTGLPALCWGHCKYAAIPTTDSINLLTMKHLENKIE